MSTFTDSFSDFNQLKLGLCGPPKPFMNIHVPLACFPVLLLVDIASEKIPRVPLLDAINKFLLLPFSGLVVFFGATSKRQPWRSNGYPLQYSGLENSMDCIVHGVAKSRTRMSDFHDQESNPSFPVILPHTYLTTSDN